MPILPLVPAPRSVEVLDAAPFRVDGARVAGDADAAAELARLASARTGHAPAADPGGRIRVSVRPGGAAQSYTLTAHADGVEIMGADAAGLFSGVQTFAQLLTRDATGWIVPAVHIADAPRFAYRGAMLDVARHFFGVDDVCAFVDRIAAFKLNVLHLHLTDDQGWRLELASRPALTQLASGTAVGGDAGGSFSRADYARILAHAAARHVTIVPEIDVPGHTHAVGLAYPEIAADPVVTDAVREAAARFGGGLPERGVPYTGFAVGFSSLRLDDARTSAFLDDVLREVAACTPGPFVHLGGDEAHGTSPDAYAAAIRESVRIVADAGKTPIVWHEAAAVPDLPAAVVAQYWGSSSGGAAYARDLARAERVILSPSDRAYLDMQPHADFPLGLDWADGPTSAQDAYAWEPTDVVPGLEESRILGVEAPLWTETVRTLADIDALAFPRLAAAAEIAWSPRTGPLRTWESFRMRVAALAPAWDAAGIAYTRIPGIPWGSA